MLVPIYFQLDRDKMFNLGRTRLIGNTTINQKVPLKGLKTPPQRAVLNYYDDVLVSSPN